jgi:hypothetical protein
MKRMIVASTLSGFFGAALLLILLSAAGIVGARTADARSDAGHISEVSAATPLTSTFSYQGQLINSGSPVSNTCDFQFGLYDALTLGNRIGLTQTVSSVGVSRGLFTVLLNKSNEFGATAFNGEARWLQIAVACPAGGYTPLSPRQALTALPFALPGLRTFPNATSPNIVGGYSGNTVAPDKFGVTIGGGGGNNDGFGNPCPYCSNQANATYATIDGGVGNTIPVTGFAATIGGGYTNAARGSRATIAGGDSNNASGSLASIGGGFGNVASAGGTTIGGGLSNIANALETTVSGGVNNTASYSYSVVSGGQGNTASGLAATVSGGDSNAAIYGYSTISGGGDNAVTGTYSAIGGGWLNTVTSDAGTIAGGYHNIAGNGDLFTLGSTVGGGEDNTAAGEGATVPGGNSNLAYGSVSFAAGRYAQANHDGAFVWGDDTSAVINSSGNNQFIVRANGGIWLGKSTSDFTPTIGAGVFISTSTGAKLTTAGVWTDVSDRNAKENFATVNGRDVLAKLIAMPVSIWNYKVDDASIRHIGPTAQDFYSTFGVGSDDTHIAALDTNGVALAAIQGLYQENQDLKAQVDALKNQTTPNAPFDPFKLLSVIAFAGFMWMWLQQRRSKRSQA